MRCNSFSVVLTIAAVTLFALATSASAAVTEDDLRAWGAAQTEPFRLLFVTSTGRDATSANAADYDAFVDAAADNPGSIVSFLGTNWTALINEKDGLGWAEHIGLPMTSSGSYATATIDDPVFLLNGVAPGLYRYYNGGPYLPEPPTVPINVTEQGDTLAGLGYVWTGSRNTLGDATGRPGNFGKTLHRCFDDDAWLANTQIHSLYAMSDLLDPSAFAPPEGYLHIIKFLDDDGDGVQDPGEGLFPPGSFTFDILDATGASLGIFPNCEEITLEPGLYTGFELSQEGWIPTSPNPFAFEIEAGELTEVPFGNKIIPEPSTFVIWSLGLLALAWYAGRQRKRN